MSEVTSDLLEFFAGSRAALEAMERHVFDASSSVAMGVRNLDLQTPCLTSETTDAGIENWGQLLAHVAGRGVRIRVLLADFDPIFATSEHEAAWGTYRQLHEINRQLETPIRVVCSIHPASCDLFASLLGLPATVAMARKLEKSKLKESTNEDGESLKARLANMPGLWPFLKADGSTGTVTLKGLWRHRVTAASHHEKLLIVDDKAIFIGGVDIEYRRLGLQGFHWRDVHARMVGAIVNDARVHFEKRWAKEKPAFDNRLASLKPLSIAPPLPDPVREEVPSSIPSPSTAAESGGKSFLITQSKKRPGPFALTPRSMRREIETAYIDAVEGSKNFIYLETQFLRSLKLGQALADQAGKSPSLRLAIVLPHLPERALNENEVNTATRHGIYLQCRILRQLSDAYQDRIGVFTVVNVDSDSTDAEDGGQQHINDMSIAYVHSKVIIADQTVGILGSANANGRSFQYDTETAVRVTDRSEVRRLWDVTGGVLTEGQAPNLIATGADILKAMKSAAFETAGRKGEEAEHVSLSARIVPFDMASSVQLAKRSVIVPSGLV